MSGQELKEMIFELGYTVAQIADGIGITEQALNRRFLADDVKVGTLIEIANITNKNVCWFLGEKQSVERENGIITELRNTIKEKDEKIDMQNKYIGKLEFLLEQNNIEIDNTVKRGAS